MQMAVHERHLILVLEIAHRTQPSNRDGRAHAPREINEQAFEFANLDARVITYGCANEVFALIDREQRLLGDVDGERYDESIDEPEAPPDEILVTRVIDQRTGIKAMRDMGRSLACSGCGATATATLRSYPVR